MAKKVLTETAEAPASTFPKEALLKSQRYHERRDLLTVLLEDSQQYSHADVGALIDKFMERKAK